MRKILEGGMFSWPTGSGSRRLDVVAEPVEEVDGLTCALESIF